MLDQDTAVGKSFRVAVWLIVANVAIAVLTTITSHQNLFNSTTVSLANILLVLGKNLLDPKVDNM